MDQHEIPFAERRFRNARLRRAFSPSFSVHIRESSLRVLRRCRCVERTVTDFDHAARAIGLAILFDSLDGRVARIDRHQHRIRRTV